MATTPLTEKEIKDLIKKVVADELKQQVKDKKVTSKEDVRDIVKDMLIKQYKFFWEKKATWINHL